MKRLTAIAIALWIALLFPNALYAQSGCNSRLSPYVAGAPAERAKHIRQLQADGKESLKMLLNEIDADGVANVDLGGSISSTKLPMTCRVYCGTAAAYLFEYILSTPVPASAPSGADERWTPSIDPGTPDFHSGCIVHRPTHMPITEDALSAIQSRYAAWWKLNENKTLEELRREWTARNRPLSDGDYTWD